MPSPTTARVLLRHFPRGAYTPATDQCAAPPSVRSLISLSLRAISAVRAGGGGAQGRAGGRRIPRGGGFGGGGSGEIIRDNSGATCSKAGAEKRKTVAKNMMTARASRRQNETGGSQVSNDGAGGRYRSEGTDQEESKMKSSSGVARRWRGMRRRRRLRPRGGGRGGVSKTRTATPRVSTGSGAGNSPEGATAGRGDTWVVTSVAGDEAGEGGHHEERPGERERVSVPQENPSGESSGVGVREGVCEAS